MFWGCDQRIMEGRGEVHRETQLLLWCFIKTLRLSQLPPSVPLMTGLLIAASCCRGFSSAEPPVGSCERWSPNASASSFNTRWPLTLLCRIDACSLDSYKGTLDHAGMSIRTQRIRRIPWQPGMNIYCKIDGWRSMDGNVWCLHCVSTQCVIFLLV